MVTKLDFTKAWSELTSNEQITWDKRCQKSKTNEIKNFAKKNNIDFNKLSHICIIDSVQLWDEKHIKTLRKNCVEKYKPMLKAAVDIEEYNKIYAECAKELEKIGI